MKEVNCNELSLKKVKINGRVIGKFGLFEIEQTYYNDTNQVLEVGYTFPIVETATVTGFKVTVGEKVLVGKCQETKKAKMEYTQNMVNGNSAYLMEQQDDNVFKISLGKIDKKEEVTVKISYVDMLEIVDNKINILIPTLVTPRYKSKITSMLNYGKVEYNVDFSINILKSLNIKSIDSQSHKIKVIDDDSIYNIEVLDHDMSKDFKLKLELKNELSSNAIISKTRDNKDMVYLSFMPEILESYEDTEKEFIFIIDVSGSMSGEKIKETKYAVIECLKQLDVGDKFNIVAFESRFETLSINSIEVNEKNLKLAIDYINSLQVRGGTEILSPIKFALYEKDTPKTILLFTDGQVGNGKEIISYIKNNINQSRIFPFGIDTDVNSSFIRNMAKFGNGKAELIQPNERIDDKILRTFSRIQTPLLQDLTIDYGSNKVIDLINEDDSLFNYEFFNVFAKIEKIEDDIELKGKILDKEYSWKIKKENIINTDVDLELLFAKKKIEIIEEYIGNTYDRERIELYKEMIVELSEKYNINSKYTSFITVYERENKILDVPTYQETILSGNTLDYDALDCQMCFSSSVDYGTSREMSIGSRVGQALKAAPTNKAKSVDLDIPPFLRKDYKGEATERKKSNKEILEEFINEYFNEFINEYFNEFIKAENKSLLTYLLFGLYSLKVRDINLNYSELLEFIAKDRSELLSNEICMKILCLCYKYLRRNNVEEDKILELLDERYKKVLYTNMNIKVDLNILTENEIVKIVSNNSIKENIDAVLWYLINNKYGLF